MFVQPSEGGQTPLCSNVAKCLEAAYQPLDILLLPYELVQVVVSHVTAIDDLRSLALVNKLFQDLAEPGIYKHVLIRKGSEARNLALAIRRRPVRATWVRSLKNACLSDSFSGLPELPNVIPLMSRLEVLDVETPDCNELAAKDRMPWIEHQDAYNQILLGAIQPNVSLLPNLRSLTLHFVDKNRSLYSLGHYSVIFLHPTLTNLTISCAHIDPPEILHPLLLRTDLTNTTPLTSLELVECDFHPQGLYHLLRLPHNLTSLTITEATHHRGYDRDRRYSGLNPRNVLQPLHALQPNLQNLRIARLYINTDYLFSLRPINLDSFMSLHTLEFAHVQSRRFMPPPPANWCDLVHATGPQSNTGAPNTTTLIYSDIPPQWWRRALEFFTCAFTNKISHGIENLKTLKLVLIDDELLIERIALLDVIVRTQQNREREVEDVRRSVRELGKLGRRESVGIRVVVEWVRPDGRTIPPYLLGEYQPEVRKEYDSGVVF